MDRRQFVTIATAGLGSLCIGAIPATAEPVMAAQSSVEIIKSTKLWEGINKATNEMVAEILNLLRISPDTVFNEIKMRLEALEEQGIINVEEISRNKTIDFKIRLTITENMIKCRRKNTPEGGFDGWVMCWGVNEYGDEYITHPCYDMGLEILSVLRIHRDLSERYKTGFIPQSSYEEWIKNAYLLPDGEMSSLPYHSARFRKEIYSAPSKVVMFQGSRAV